MRLFDTFADYVSINIEAFDNQNLSNTAWAYATTQLPSAQVFERLTWRACGRLSSFRLDELCGMMCGAPGGAEEPYGMKTHTKYDEKRLNILKNDGIYRLEHVRNQVQKHAKVMN